MGNKDKVYESFWTVYQMSIAPKLECIDLLLKITEDFISPDDAASVLSIQKHEVLEIMEKKLINVITKKDFLKIMSCGSSFICELYRRELECGSPYIYTADEIAYIYEINTDEVKAACTELGMRDITQGMLPFVFAKVRV